MATITFVTASGTHTLWDDSSDGIGGVDYLPAALQNGDMVVPMPRATGSILKEGPRPGVIFPVGFTKRFSNQAGEGTFLAALEVIRDARLVGTLTVTGHAAVSGCILYEIVPSRPTSPWREAGTTYQTQDWLLGFFRLY